MIDVDVEKLEGTKMCLATLRKLRSQMTAFKFLSPDGVEKQHLDTSLMHIERIQGCLNALLQKVQERIDNKEQSQKPKRTTSRNIKL
jgi:hypothetical protein